MSRNGSGVYNLPTNSWNPAIVGVSATPADWQALINDVANALTQSLSADGQTPLSGNLNMAGNKLTGLSAGTATGQSLRFEQLFSQGLQQDVAAAATTDIGAQLSTLINVTGSATITSFGTNYNGPRFLRFAGVCTLTNSATLVLPGGANITTAAGDSAIAVPLGNPATGWRVVAFTTFTGNVNVPSINGGQLAGMRNKIINGALKIDQRNAGASQTFTAAAALAYCVDRFYGYCTGANISGQRITLSNGQNRYRFTGAASNTAVGFGHRIEAVNCLDLAGSTATFSVKLSSSSLTTITWTAYYANTTDTFGTLASPTRTQIATGTFTINSTEATYSTNISVPFAATTGIEILLTGGALLATQTLTIGDLQLEVGEVATPFEHRPIGAELALCERYYQIVRWLWSGYASGAAIDYYSATNFRTVMRAAPTITKTAGTFINCTDPGSPSSNDRSFNAFVRSSGAGTTFGEWTGLAAIEL